MKSNQFNRLLLIPFSLCLSISTCGVLPSAPTAKSGSSAPKATKPPPVQDRVYAVVRGDTLRGISVQTTGTTQNWDIIAGYNKLAYPYALRIGQQIRIPSRLLLAKPAANVQRPPPKPVAVIEKDGPPNTRLRPPATTNKVPPPASKRPAARPTAVSSAGRGTAEIKDGPPKTVAAKPARDSGWITITGSYYPREVKMQPSSGSDYLMLVRPGSRVRYIARQGDWYKVITDRGEGYVEAEHALEQ